MTKTLQLAVLVINFAALVYIANFTFRRKRALVFEILRGIRVWHVVIALPTLVTVVLTGITLSQVDFLAWSWWQAIGGEGNASTGFTSGGNILAPLFVALLIAILPFAAWSEESSFRKGAENWGIGKLLRNSIGFGLVHLTAGLSLAYCSGVALAGIIFALVYRYMYSKSKDQDLAVLASTRVHTCYNYTVAIFLVLLLFF